MRDGRTVLEHISDYLLKEHTKASIRVSLAFRTELPKLRSNLDRKAFAEMAKEKPLTGYPPDRYNAVSKALTIVWQAQDQEREERIRAEE